MMTPKQTASFLLVEPEVNELEIQVAICGPADISDDGLQGRPILTELITAFYSAHPSGWEV